MVDPLSFVVAGSLLFVFWAYGVVSFALDVKNKLIPAVRQYRQGRAEGADPPTEEERDEEAAREKLRQLY